MAVSAKLVKELRASCGAGMMDCKKALAANNADLDAAAVRLCSSLRCAQPALAACIAPSPR